MGHLSVFIDQPLLWIDKSLFVIHARCSMCMQFSLLSSGLALFRFFRLPKCSASLLLAFIANINWKLINMVTTH